MGLRHPVPPSSLSHTRYKKWLFCKKWLFRKKQKFTSKYTMQNRYSDDLQKMGVGMTFEMCCHVLQWVATCCGVLQCVAVFYKVLQCVAVC